MGYWLLALPGWIGLAFATLSYGFAVSDLKWAALILIGAIAMRGAGCTYNDIVDQDLDRQVERTALRPLPAGTVTTKQASMWLFAQCGVGLIVLLCLPRLAQIISLCSIPLVAAYPFMKRITWWPQIWLGMTFNWAVLVAYAAKTGTVSWTLFILYIGLVFWTVGYDTIYACQDIEDDAMVGIKSTARKFGGRVKFWVSLTYAGFIFLGLFATHLAILNRIGFTNSKGILIHVGAYPNWVFLLLWAIPTLIAANICLKFNPTSRETALKLFKRNWLVAMTLIFGFLIATRYAWTAF